MSDRFVPITMEQLTAWIFGELRARDAIFGIPRELFFVPDPSDAFTDELYGHRLETPFGVAAGPHSQMAQNIVMAWLCGARFMELKTVQTLDELEVSKPCIDMQDEGYNVEWSQELKVEQSFDEYLRAWVLIHALHRYLGFPGDSPGVIFNISVGYDLAGIQQPNVQAFLQRMRSIGPLLGDYRAIVEGHWPGMSDVDVPTCMSDNVTLSTMHGCPPDEVGKICHYLVEQGFHTSVKLNPTLLGPTLLRQILNVDLGYTDVTVPDEAFGHDLKYADAVEIIRDLRQAAAERGVVFGVKLTNTLEVQNHRDEFSADEKMMYLSGRPLQAISVNVARLLSEEFDGDLLMSYAGGANAFNVAELLRAGMRTITTCSDLLKYGGYLRLLQYIEATRTAMGDAADLDAFRGDALSNLVRYADAVRSDRTLQKETFERQRTKTTRTLGAFDCIQAPCVDECPISQKVPNYMMAVRDGQLDEAVQIARQDNPMAAVLGRACDHLCQFTCVRTHLDEPLAIRELKRFVMSHEKPVVHSHVDGPQPRIAIIGAGPCGLGVARYLGEVGYDVTLFEAHPYAGGMVSGTIPGYRAPQGVIRQDLERIEALGVDIRYGQRAGTDFTLADLRTQGFDQIVVAIGAQEGLRLNMEGGDAEGVVDGLTFLRQVREGHAPPLGQRVGVIGGGDVAMDCARSAMRVTGRPASVVYRRTRSQMPAQREEVHDLLTEGNELLELASPSRVLVEGGRMVGLVCDRMELGERDASGRRRPIKSGEQFPLKLDSLILAIGQKPVLDFFGDEAPELSRKGYLAVDETTLQTSVAGVYAGGDIAGDGPDSIVGAIGDGKRIAAAIRHHYEGIDMASVLTPPVASGPPAPVPDGPERARLLKQRATRAWRLPIPHRPAEDRVNFEEVIDTLDTATAQAEASRCLECHRMCSTCVAVCPNAAFFTWDAAPFSAELATWVVRDGSLHAGPSERFAVDQPHQVALFTGFCNECGNCATFCPTAGRPYLDKPRLYLDEAEFSAEDDNAFMLVEGGMRGRFGGQEHRIVLGDVVEYTTPQLRAELTPGALEVRELVWLGGVEGEQVSMTPAATMLVLLRGLRSSMPFLPVA